MTDLITAQNVKAQNKEYLHSIRGVHTTMTTVIDGEPAILVLVDKPINLPKSINGVRVVMRTETRAKLTQITTPTPSILRDFLIRPVPAGVAIGPVNSDGTIDIGTAGLILDDRNGNKYILSCSHVFAIN